MPYMPAGSTTAIHVPVGFSLFYDTGSTPAPTVPTLGLTSVPDIDSGGITVDSQNNFILAVTDSSLYGGGPGVVHINSALTAFLADPRRRAPSPDSVRDRLPGRGGNELSGVHRRGFGYVYDRRRAVALQRPGQPRAAPERLRHRPDPASPGPGGTTVAGDGSGQTIAIVEEGVDPTLGADLTTFDQFFGIPAPPSFQVVDQNGVTTQNLDIVGEASLDVEWAHAVAPGASIVVYNAAYEPEQPDRLLREPDRGDAASLEAAGGLGRHPELWRCPSRPSPHRA